MDERIKDNIVFLFISYFVCFLFWFQYRNSIYTLVDYYVFMISFMVMLIVPIIVFEFRLKKNREDIV